MQRQLTTTQIKQIVILYKGGWSSKQIGKILDPQKPFHRNTILKALKENNIPIRPRYDPSYEPTDQIDPRLKELVVRLYHERQMSSAEIGRLLERHPSSIRSLLHKNTIIRNRTESSTLAHRARQRLKS